MPEQIKNMAQRNAEEVLTRQRRLIRVSRSEDEDRYPTGVAMGTELDADYRRALAEAFVHGVPFRSLHIGDDDVGMGALRTGGREQECHWRDDLGVYIVQTAEWLEEAWAHEAEVKRLDASTAGQRAHQLLREFLTDDQRQTLDCFNFFDVIKVGRIPWGDRLSDLYPDVFFAIDRDPDRNTLIPTRVYRIHLNTTMGNVSLLCAGLEHQHLCLHPPEPYPTADVALTQMLRIHEDELNFLCEANLTGARGTRRAFDHIVTEVVRKEFHV